MANEATLRVGLTIDADNVQWRPSPVTFRGTVTGRKGPCPGAITASLSGTDVDLSGLVKPGYATITNLDLTNYVDVGVYEPSTGVFYPLFEVLPGETYPMRFSRNLGEQWAGSVTGTGTDAVNNTVRIRANGAAVNVFVAAFEA